MRLRLAGHPLHPALVHFPIALWIVGSATDIGGWVMPAPEWWIASFWAQSLGLAIGVLAMLAGFLDYVALQREHPGQNTAIGHMMVMGTAWSLFLLSVAGRGLPTGEAPPVWTVVVAVAGALTTLAGAWLGGQLVYGYAVGVREDADRN